MKTCPRCQLATAEAATFCSCGYRYESGDSHVVTVTRHRILATPPRRYWAQVIDAFVALVIAFALLPLANLTENLAYLPAVGFLSYFLLADGLPGGRSVGKRILGLAVITDEAGTPCTLLRSLLRNVTTFLGLFDWLFIFGARRKRLGDFLARTEVVVFTRGPEPGSAPVIVA